MSKSPFVLTIAGFDPSGGAGGRCETFEQHHVYGFAVNTGNTIQTENEFFEIQWTDLDFVLKSLEKLFENYNIKAVKMELFIKLFKRIVWFVKNFHKKQRLFGIQF
jgi:hydroxymethylpyrimidine/phosphomethylpyrimidine kinase